MIALASPPVQLQRPLIMGALTLLAGGSLLLVPVACASFGISNDIAMQVVGAGFIIGVLQDSCETALNSSSDVLFTATAEFAERAKEGRLTAVDMVPATKE